jgi:glycerol-3-phosphate acyltransferase PlsY
VGRIRGIDLRQHGSGSLGATNAFRVLGWRAASPVFIADIFKGWFPTYFFPRWDHSDVAGNDRSRRDDGFGIDDRRFPRCWASMCFAANAI